MNKTIDWNPRRKGEIYCSPSCGHGCTHVEYERACQEANACAKLLGPSWTARVYENLGWHWSVSSACKRVTVTRRADGQYHAYLSEEGPGGRWTSDSGTAQGAVHNVVGEMRRDLSPFADLLKNGVAPLKLAKVKSPRRRHSRDGSLRCDLCSPFRCRYAP